MTDSTQETRIIHAAAHVDPEGSIVESGGKLAEAVLDALRDNPKVQVQLAGIKGASSSYFNVFFATLREHLGMPEIDGRISFQFSSSVQEAVFRRSRDALNRSISNLQPNPEP